MTFHVGQKVARFAGREATPGVNYPPLDQACHVTNVFFDTDGEQMIELLEYPNAETLWNCAGWRAKFFRPIVERKTDIAIFTALLNTKQRELQDCQ